MKSEQRAQKIVQIARREHRSIEEVVTLIERWCFPIAFAIAAAVELALANDPKWRNWVTVHRDWVDEGRYDNQVRW